MSRPALPFTKPVELPPPLTIYDIDRLDFWSYDANNLSVNVDGVWDFFVDAWPWVLTIVSIALSIGVTIHAVLWKRDIRAAIAWTGLAWLAPLLGAGAYFSLGVNRVQRKATRLKLRAPGGTGEVGPGVCVNHLWPRDQIRPTTVFAKVFQQ